MDCDGISLFEGVEMIVFLCSFAFFGIGFIVGFWFSAKIEIDEELKAWKKHANKQLRDKIEELDRETRNKQPIVRPEPYIPDDIIKRT